MAVHYCYKIDPPVTNHELVRAGGMRDDETLVRKLVIPESPDEELRGEKYDQDMIDWLHNSERNHIIVNLPADAQLVKVWTEKCVNAKANMTKAGKLAHVIPLQPAPESN